MTTDQVVGNEAELQSRLEFRIREALPLLPANIKLERHLRLRLGHHNVLIDGFRSDKDSIHGRYDVLVLSGNTPLLLAELKEPNANVGEDEVMQALSYARLNTPLVPLVLVTNGKTTLLIRTYDGAALDASDVAASRLQTVLGAASALAAAATEHAIRTLLGTSKDVWTQVFNVWSDEAINAITGNIRDFKVPITEQFAIPRTVVPQIKQSLTGGARIVVLHGPPLSGVTNGLAQLARTKPAGPTLFIDSAANPDVLQFIANRLTRELCFGVSKDDLRAWFNTGRGLLDITVVIDGLPREDTEELVENASAGLFRLVLGMDSEVFAKNSKVAGRVQQSLLGRSAVTVGLDALSDEEFEEACAILRESFGTTFFNGAQHCYDLRWPRALRVLAASLPSKKVSQAETTDGATLLMIPSFTGPLALARYNEAFFSDPSLNFDMQKLTTAYLVDVAKHCGDPDWLVATWGRPCIEPGLLEETISTQRIERLCKNGFISWAEVPAIGPRLLVRVEELLSHHVAEAWKNDLEKALEDDAVADELVRMVALSTVIPAGEVALAAAIIRLGQKKPEILGSAIPLLISKEPTISRLKEGAKVEFLVKDRRIRLNFGKGMDEEVIGDIQPWLVLSHLASFPMSVNNHQRTANVSIFAQLGSFPHLLYRPQAVEMARVPGFHFHDIPGIGSLPCLTTGIVEPLTQAMLTHMYVYPRELIDLAEHALEKKSSHLAWRVLTVAVSVNTCTEVSVQDAGKEIEDLIRPWWGSALSDAIKKHTGEPVCNEEKADKFQQYD